MLTIEPMDEEDASNRTQRLKRLAFYENNGYKQNSNIFLEAGIEHIKMFKNIDHPLMDKAKKR